MINHRQMTVEQIKVATGDQEVEKVIYDSLNLLQTKDIHGALVKNYMASMIISLLSMKGESLSPTSRQNIAKAVEIFKKLI